MPLDSPQQAKRRAAGAFGEDIAAAHLAQHGFRIVARNFRTRMGEIDLIAADERYLVFAEVKLRAANARVSGPEAVTYQKQQKLRAAAEEYLQKHPAALWPRFDVIAIQTASNGQVGSIQWIENAF
jgi:putative endonuclease